MGRADFEAEQQKRMVKSLFGDLRPTPTVGVSCINRHAKPGAPDEQAISQFFRTQKQEEPLAPGAMRCPLSPPTDQLFRKMHRHHPPPPLKSPPEEKLEGFQAQWLRKEGFHGAQEFELPRMPEEPGSFATTAQLPSCPRASPPYLPSYRYTTADIEGSPEFFNPSNEQRTSSESQPRVVPRPAAREPLPVVEYTHNSNRHHSQQPSPASTLSSIQSPQPPKVTESSPVPMSLIVSKAPDKVATAPPQSQTLQFPKSRQRSQSNVSQLSTEVQRVTGHLSPLREERRYTWKEKGKCKATD